MLHNYLEDSPEGDGFVLGKIDLFKLDKLGGY